MHEFHEYSQMFPLMEGQEFEDLVADIEANGQHELIVMLDNKVLDGRNRYRACQRLKIKPRIREWQCVDGDPLAYVWSANFNRRHLTQSQKAIAAAERATFLKRGDVKSQREASRSATSPIVVTNEEVAKDAGTS